MGMFSHLSVRRQSDKCYACCLLARVADFYDDNFILKFVTESLPNRVAMLERRAGRIAASLSQSRTVVIKTTEEEEEAAQPQSPPPKSGSGASVACGCLSWNLALTS